MHNILGCVFNKSYHFKRYQHDCSLLESIVNNEVVMRTMLLEQFVIVSIAKESITMKYNNEKKLNNSFRYQPKISSKMSD